MPLSSSVEVDDAVRAAGDAFPAWSATPIKERVQVFFRYRALLERHLDELASLITEEHGKIRPEAEAEVLKAIELTEFACSLPQIVAGEVLEVSRGVECRLDRHPVGVVASIVPFNFPSMVPHWTIPNAIALGNCMVLKPSELVPLSAGRIAELLAEAGLPDGRVQRGTRGAGGGRGHLRPSGDRGGHLRRLHSGRQAGLPSRHQQSQARPRAGRRQEPSVRPARRRSRHDLHERRRLHVGMHRPALHGGVGDARRLRRPIT